MGLKNRYVLGIMFLVAPCCFAMSSEGSSSPQEKSRPRQVTFRVPLDDRFIWPCNEVDVTQDDERHRPMKHPLSATKRSYLANELLEHVDEQSYGARFMGCLCRLAYAEFDESDFYRSLRN